MGRWGLLFGYGDRRDEESGGNALVAILMLILAPLAALLLQLGISRQREYQADASGARMVGHPYGLISALRKLDAYNRRLAMDVPPAVSSLFIVAPLNARQTLAGLFSTHPPIERRIQQLEQMVVTR